MYPATLLGRGELSLLLTSCLDLLLQLVPFVAQF